ncbi:MAG: helix-turn-helix domain-containing protein [Chloroflexi bacterium]|nr:helix-turn-helix domain-containing protein [Chloroflexota bacterium]
MKAYPLSVRLEILAAVDRGMPAGEVARAFGVGPATVNRYVAQRRTTGSPAPRPHPGRPPLIPPERHPALLALVAAAPRASQEAYCRSWREGGGAPVSTATMSRTLHRLGLSRRRPREGRP